MLSAHAFINGFLPFHLLPMVLFLWLYDEFLVFSAHWRSQKVFESSARLYNRFPSTHK
jgi:hypothetical protein